VTKPCTFDTVQRATAAAFGLTQADLVAQDRRPPVALARQVAMYLSREMTGASFPAIGAAFGGRNHSTVLHACAKIKRTLQQPGEEAQLVHRLHSELTGTR
jgi:chromosomal replication initiator protein